MALVPHLPWATIMSSLRDFGLVAAGKVEEAVKNDRLVRRRQHPIAGVQPSSIAKPIVKQHERMSAFIIVIASLARLPCGTQKEVNNVNPNGAATSQFAGLLPATSAVRARNVISSIGGTRNEKTAAMATPRQTLVGIIGRLHIEHPEPRCVCHGLSESRFRSRCGLQFRGDPARAWHLLRQPSSPLRLSSTELMLPKRGEGD